MDTATLPPDAVVVLTDSQLSAALDDEVIILNLDNGTYYGLNEVAAHVWSRLQEPIRVGALVAAVTETYEVDPADAERDVHALLRSLEREQLIRLEAASRAA